MTTDGKTLRVIALSFAGTCTYPFGERCDEAFENQNLIFEFGKAYCLESPNKNGAGALSWVLSGWEKEKEGSIFMGEKLLTHKERRTISIRAGMDEGFFKKTVLSKIQNGVKNYGGSEKWFIDAFELTRPERRLDYMSGEKWRASMAIGMANKKSIFCFPWISKTVIEDYRDLWFSKTLNILKENKALIILPAENAKIWGEIPDCTYRIT